jgi:hypothetical protein
MILKEGLLFRITLRLSVFVFQKQHDDNESEKIILFGGTPNRVDAFDDTWVLSTESITTSNPTTTTSTTATHPGGGGGFDPIVLGAIGIGATVFIIVLVVFLRRR